MLGVVAVDGLWVGPRSLLPGGPPQILIVHWVERIVSAIQYSQKVRDIRLSGHFYIANNLFKQKLTIVVGVPQQKMSMSQ